MKFERFNHTIRMASLRYCRMSKLSLITMWMLIHFSLPAQVISNSFTSEIKNLKPLADSIQKGTTDSVRLIHAAAFDSLLFELLNKEGSMEFRFDSLKNLSVLTARNNMLRVYTFVCPLTGGKQYRYYGFIQLKNRKDEKPQVVKLTDVFPERQVAEKLMLNPQHWPGALYYKMISASVKGKTFYTMLGWRGIDNESTMKLIDVIAIENGKISFGAPLFQTDYGIRQRILFEYNARAVMSLSYEEKKKRIVFDHLSPPSPQLTGNFKTYGPDFTYDAYQWKQGKWVLYKNVELRNPPSSDPAAPTKKINRKVFYKPEG